MYYFYGSYFTLLILMALAIPFFYIAGYFFPNSIEKIARVYKLYKLAYTVLIIILGVFIIWISL
jgi:hypothetical protein